MHHGAAEAGVSLIFLGEREGHGSLRKNLDSTATKSFVAHAAYTILCDQNMSVSTTITSRQTVAKPQLRFFGECQTAPQGGNHSTLIDDGVR